MHIIRRGSRANHGPSDIEFSAPTFSWVKNDSTITIRQSDIKDFSSAAHHSYAVKIKTTEIHSIIAVLAKAAKDDPECFEKILEPSLKQLTQLQIIAAGAIKK